MSEEEKTSTGTGDSATVRGSARVPTTTVSLGIALQQKLHLLGGQTHRLDLRRGHPEHPAQRLDLLLPIVLGSAACLRLDGQPGQGKYCQQLGGSHRLTTLLHVSAPFSFFSAFARTARDGDGRQLFKFRRQDVFYTGLWVVAPFTVAGSSTSSCEDGTYAQFGVS